MKKTIMPNFARVLASDSLLSLKQHVYHLKQSLYGQQRTLDVFIKVDDPYSYLLVQVLDNMTTRFDVTLKFHVFIDQDPHMFPQLALWRAHAVKDAGHLAKLYHLSAPSGELIEISGDKEAQQNIMAVAQALVNIESSDSFLAQAKILLGALWQGKGTALLNQHKLKQRLESQPSLSAQQLAQAKQKLADNFAALTRKGHYLGAMLYFQGDWYWGIDRLAHLEARLIKLGYFKAVDKKETDKTAADKKAVSPEPCSLNSLSKVRQLAPTIYFDKTYRDFCQTDTSTLTFPASHCAIEFYWSARSPYSYIALERITQLAAHYKLALNIKPVLPMMMRGLTVPTAKKMYIFHDTKREAKKLGLNYGFVADPLGAAVERCYALLAYATAENKLTAFLLSFARAVNTQGIHADTDPGLQLIVERAGLNWAIAKTHVNNTSWQTQVAENLDEMMSLGLWGVPCMRFGKHCFWGQDRIGMLENVIKKALAIS
ncbi:hypothetical protein DXX93_14975 [Thalassotalea euphylliae]|uniref:DSBA-like thioredoxin domain-containing protein n=1 Tax=Thalassotalea euphylliae TaxID=1655234 RepID=A0A3E0TUX2_9GAMM|nr:DsbA family protein [Thalassotalea euphylliae]REL27732.1 hypothetical protein DXX93_14975 [Thalassotalea euphylliae]